MILSAQSIRKRGIFTPFCEKSFANGLTYGLSHAGYDVRIAEDVELKPGDFTLASTVERFEMPEDLVGMVHDKSTWARRGLSLFNTVIEPGWHGWLTLELVNNGSITVRWYFLLGRVLPLLRLFCCKWIPRPKARTRANIKIRKRGLSPLVTKG